MIVKMGSSSPNRDEHKTYLSCHHPEILLSATSKTIHQQILRGWDQILQIFPDVFFVAPGSRIRLPYHGIGPNFGKDHPKKQQGLPTSGDGRPTHVSSCPRGPTFLVPQLPFSTCHSQELSTSRVVTKSFARGHLPVPTTSWVKPRGGLQQNTAVSRLTTCPGSNPLSRSSPCTLRGSWHDQIQLRRQWRLSRLDFTTKNGAFKRWNLWAPSVENGTQIGCK